MKVRYFRSMLMACTATAALSAMAPALAQDGASGGTTLLDVIVAKGDRLKPGSATDTPLSSTVEKEEIEDKQITSIEELGRSIEPGVNFNRETGAVNIRGLEGSRVLTTIDGIPLRYLADATRDSSGGVDSFDFSSLSAVDVMRGADSSRAGAGALGGVLGLFTLEPEDLIEEGRDWGGIVKVTYDSADNSIGGSAAVARRFGNTSVLFQGGYKQGDERGNQGLIDSYGVTRTMANPAEFDQHNLLFKLRQHIDGGHMIGITAERFRKDQDTDARTNQEIGGNYQPGNYRTIKDSDRDRISIDYTYDGSSGVLDSAAASLYWMNQLRVSGYDGIRSTSGPLGFISRANDLEEETFGFVGSASKTVTTGALTHNLVMGLDVATGTTTQYSSGTDTCPPRGPFAFSCNFLHTNQADSPKVNSNRFGVFIDDEIAFGESGFYVTPGIRFDWLEHTPKMTPEFAANATSPVLPPAFEDAGVSPKLRLGYRPNQMVELYGQWAMAFRAPTAGELYSSYGGPGTYARIGNPGLQTETSHGFEVGAKLGDEDFGGRVSLFYNRYSNFIETRALTGAEAMALGYNPALYPFGITGSVNLDRAHIYGAELSVHKRFDNGFSVRAGLAYAQGEDINTGAFLQSVAPFKGVAGVAYDTENWGVGVDFIGVAKARGQTVMSGTSMTYFATPSYGVVDMHGWWEPEQIEGLKINAGIYNVFNETYYDYTSVRTGGTQPMAFYSEPGRTFKLSLSHKF